MRSADLDLIFVAEGGLPEPDHWLTRWSSRLSSARFVAPTGDDAQADAVVRNAAEAKKPIFFVAHSTGVISVVKAAPAMRSFDVRGAFFVAPPAEAALATLDGGRWGEIPRVRLPFASVVVASRTDPWASFEDTSALAEDWGAELIDAGEVGRLDAASGHGPWPDGLLRLAGLFQRL